LAREEVFGPVLSVLPFNDEADARRTGECDGLRAWLPLCGLVMAGVKSAWRKGFARVRYLSTASARVLGLNYPLAVLARAGMGAKKGLLPCTNLLERKPLVMNHGA
jgi:hypothetical protein